MEGRTTQEDEAQSVTAIIREEVKVGNGVLDTRFPERAGKVEFVDESSEMREVPARLNREGP